MSSFTQEQILEAEADRWQSKSYDDFKTIERLRLYEVTGRLAELEAIVADNDGEIDDAMIARLDALEGALEAKVDGIGHVIANAKAEAASFKEERERLQAREKAAERRAEGFKGYLHRSLAALGRDKVKGLRFTARIQRNAAPSIRWTRDAEAIPEGFRRVTIDVDGKAAQEAFRLDLLPEGFSAELGSHLRIS